MHVFQLAVTSGLSCNYGLKMPRPSQRNSGSASSHQLTTGMGGGGVTGWIDPWDGRVLFLRIFAVQISPNGVHNAGLH